MINSIKKHEIDLIANNKKVREYFTSIKVFGSSITNNCSEESDIDLFVTIKNKYRNSHDMNEAYKLLLSIGSSDKDILFSHEQENCFNKKLYKNMTSGVEIL